jgi:KDO2-lipid IV(A) lauroyltransferase
MLRLVFFWLIFNIAGRLPIRAMYAIADVVAELAYRLFPRVRENVWENLRHVMPAATPKRKVRTAARRVFRNVTRYYADLAYMPRMDLQEFFTKRLRLHGVRETLGPAVESGRGVIILSAHYGNPEMVGQGLLPLGVKMVALTEPLDPPALSRMIDRRRGSQGHEFGPVNVGNVKRAIKQLRRGGVVALMGDRDIHGPKMRLPFFGEETWMPTGPIEVGLRTGAIVIPSFCARRGMIFDAYMEEPLRLEQTGDFEEDARRGALEWIERLEARLRSEPEQWAVLERIWEEDKPVEGC